MMERNYFSLYEGVRVERTRDLATQETEGRSKWIPEQLHMEEFTGRWDTIQERGWTTRCRLVGGQGQKELRSVPWASPHCPRLLQL